MFSAEKPTKHGTRSSSGMLGFNSKPNADGQDVPESQETREVWIWSVKTRV